MAAGNDAGLPDRAAVWRASRLRGAGPALPAVHVPSRKHGIAFARAAWRIAGPGAARPAALAAGLHWRPDVVRDCRQELDPACRFRGRDDGAWHGEMACADG